MGRTQLTSREIGSVQRNDFDTSTTGSAVITKLVAGTNISLSQTGVDAGTGDVTVNLSGTISSSNLPDFYFGSEFSGTGADSGANALVLAAGSIAYTKIQNVTGNSILGRVGSTSGVMSAVAIGLNQLVGRGASGDLTAITLGTNLSMSGTTLNATGSGSGTFDGGLVNDDIEYASSSDGTIHETPNGARFRLTVDEYGAVGSTQLTMATPQSFTATVASSSQINLAWSAVPYADSYVVDRATDSGFTTDLASGIYTGSGTSYNNTGLASSTTYYYRIKAIKSGVSDSGYATDNEATSAGGSGTDMTWTSTTHTGTVVATRDMSNPGSFSERFSRQKMTTNGYIQVQINTTEQAHFNILDAAGNYYRLFYRADNNTMKASHFTFADVEDDGSSQETFTNGLFFRWTVTGTSVAISYCATEDGTYTPWYTFTATLSAANDVKAKCVQFAGGAGNDFLNTESSGTLVNN